jgi:ribonuclease Z
MRRFIVIGLVTMAVAGAYLLGQMQGQRGESLGALADASATESKKAEGWSPTGTAPDRNVYYPGTEELAPDEMRVIACGSGMPMPRLKQAAACMLIELGNGEKFIFDMGTGSMERLFAIGIPLEYIDKVFLTHMHAVHMGDLPAFYIYGPQNNRSVPLRVWGPGGGGTRPEWGTKAAMDSMLDMWAWMTGTLAGTIDTRSMSLEVTEYDWSKVNGVVYEENGVVIRSIPAIHFEQSASFILEWNGLKLAFSGDTLPNNWWIEHTKGVDLSIHESIFMPEMAVKKWQFSGEEALNAMTTIHANPAFFAKVMAMTEPKHAVAYHFQNDFDTLPAIVSTVEQIYDGPVDYARDFMVWNVTKDGVRTRMAVPNPEYLPNPPLRPKEISAGQGRYQTPEWIVDEFPEDVEPIADQIYDAFNKENGTDFEFQLKK